MDFFERLQDTWLSQLIRESTWGYPIVGALHVLAMALFGGAALIGDLRQLGLVFAREDFRELARELRPLKWLGLAMIAMTGALLFAAQPLLYSRSVAFQIKLVLLALILVNTCIARRSAWLSLTLWAAVILAARGIAFF